MGSEAEGEAVRTMTEEEGDREYEVERIVDTRGRGGTKRYLIKWKGFGDEWNTWEPKSNLIGCEDILQAYLEQQKKRSSGKAAKRGRRSTGAKRSAKVTKGLFDIFGASAQSVTPSSTTEAEPDAEAEPVAESPAGMEAETEAGAEEAEPEPAPVYYESSSDLVQLLDSLPQVFQPEELLSVGSDAGQQQSLVDRCLHNAVIGAIRADSVDSLRFYLSGQPGKFPESPLVFACRMGRGRMVELLLEAGLDPSALDPATDRSPLMGAVESGHLAVAARLLHWPGCDLDVANSKGDTALTLALRLGNVAMAQLLLQHGCNPARTAPTVRDPFAVARSLPLKEMLHLLERHVDQVGGVLSATVQEALGAEAQLGRPITQLHVLTRARCTLTFELAGQLPRLPCVLALANAVLGPDGARARLRGRCLVKEAWLNSVKQMPLSSAGNFIVTCSPLRQGRNTVCLVPSLSFKEPERFRLLLRVFEVELADQHG